MANFYNLPDDVLVLILKRLPSKTLIKFLSVSKSWYSLITTPDFISAHHHHHCHSKSKPLHLYFNSGVLGSIFSRRHTDLQFPRALRGFACASFAGSSCGVVCLFNPDGAVCLWNPAIGKYINIDPFPIQQYRDQRLSLGFGFDSSTNDFQVVAISYCSSRTPSVGLEGSASFYARIPRSLRTLYTQNLHGVSSLTPSTSPQSPPCTYVFSLNCGAWRTAALTSGSWEDLSRISKASLVVDGVIYWIVSGSGKYGTSILTFDVGSESFEELGLPSPLIDHAKDTDLRLAVADNSLAVVQLWDGWPSGVWLMIKEGVEVSWRLAYRIRDPFMMPNIVVDHYTKTQVLITTCHGSLIVLDHKNPSSCVIIARFPSVIGHAFRYTESLALLDKFSWLERMKNRKLGRK